MTSSSSCCPSDPIGADPYNIKWTVVRGDTSPLRVEFYEDDEVTPIDISDWNFTASTYDYRGDVIDQLETETGLGYVLVTAPADITALWGTGYSSKVAELAFDLQGINSDGTVWTPVIGTISVLGDVTGGSL